MLIESINSDEFLRVVGPALAHATADELADRVTERWTVQQLCQLLHNESVDVRRIACMTLGLVGDEGAMGCLTAALRDRDSQVNQLAEHALWSLWFQDGTCEARCHFKRGLAALEREDARGAVHWFHRAQRTDPRFAEAYNQCAIAHYLLEEWDASLEACRRTVDLLPIHFGAWAGLGHCHAQAGDLAEAARVYRRALAVNPRMEMIASALHRIESCIRCA